jgi:hypothetical protein
MKKAIVFLMVLAFLSLTSLADSKSTVHNLVGNWKGQGEFHDVKRGFVSGPIDLTVKEHKGQVFHGSLNWKGSDGMTGSCTFSGIISDDNKHFYLARSDGQISHSDIISNDSLLIHSILGGVNHKAIIIHLKREK